MDKVNFRIKNDAWLRERDATERMQITENQYEKYDEESDKYIFNIVWTTILSTVIIISRQISI